MLISKATIVQQILANRNSATTKLVGVSAHGWAPSNLAICKYWGKRDAVLNLPLNSSLSLSLGHKGSFTEITVLAADQYDASIDYYYLNQQPISPISQFAIRLKAFLDLFRPYGTSYQVNIHCNLPIAAGLASSACGFASIVQALNQLYQWQLPVAQLAILARLASGSATRSLEYGFVEWTAGVREDGMDSYGVQLPIVWPELKIGILLLSSAEKAISSTVAMQQVGNRTANLAAWLTQSRDDLVKVRQSILRQDFQLFATTTQANAMAMHNLITASAGFSYDLPITVSSKQAIFTLQQQGYQIFFTQDAGPNLKLLFLAADMPLIQTYFPEVEIIHPFMRPTEDQVILVNAADIAIGIADKLTAHLHGQLHRAFSIFILWHTANTTKILLQQRSAMKYHSANLWSNSCCGHPRPGEELLAAAHRRLYEELGLRLPLKYLTAFTYQANLANQLIEHEYDHLLIGYYDGQPLQFNAEEVQACCWVELPQLHAALIATPAKYSCWLLPALQCLTNYWDAISLNTNRITTG